MRRIHPVIILCVLSLFFIGCTQDVSSGLPVDEKEIQVFIEETKDSVTQLKEALGSIQESLSEAEIDSVTLLRVVDGDTLLCERQGEEIYVRLIGIDTPESVNPDESKNSEEGEMASAYTKALLSGYQTIYLQYGSDPMDDYDRYLAYVWLSDPTNQELTISTMLNYQVIRDGYASTMTIHPNTQYAEAFETAEESAKAEKVGLWN